MVSLCNEIASKVKVIEQILLTGKSVEIKRNTDGTVKIYEVEKRKK